MHKNYIFLEGVATDKIKQKPTSKGGTFTFGTISVEDKGKKLFMNFKSFDAKDTLIVNKGDKIQVSGALSFETYEKNGEKKSGYSIICGVGEIVNLSLVNKEEVSDINPVSNVAGLVDDDEVPF